MSFGWPMPRMRWLVLAALLLTLAAVGLGVGVPLYRQHTLIQRIETLGGTVYQTPGPYWLRECIGDEGMRLVDEISGIRFLPDEETFTSRTSRANRGLVLIVGYPFTSGPTIDDATLVCLTALDDLISLHLDTTNISDAGLRHIAHLTTLEALTLKGTDVSDESIPLLITFGGLQQLDIRGTQISESGAAKLRAALPQCEVESGASWLGFLGEATEENILEALDRALPNAWGPPVGRHR